MNLQPLFETQAILDKRIVEKKGLQGQDLLDKKILSLQVELGELVNELPEVFKFWSNKKNNYKKALEEYCDCLHFILSIGNDLGITHENICVEDDLIGINATETFNILFSHVSGLHTLLDVNPPAIVTDEDIKDVYHDIFECFVGLGEADLGFTWEEIEQSYYEKNKIN